MTHYQIRHNHLFSVHVSQALSKKRSTSDLKIPIFVFSTSIDNAIYPCSASQYNCGPSQSAVRFPDITHCCSALRGQGMWLSKVSVPSLHTWWDCTVSSSKSPDTYTLVVALKTWNSTCFVDNLQRRGENKWLTGKNKGGDHNITINCIIMTDAQHLLRKPY